MIYLGVLIGFILGGFNVFILMCILFSGKEKEID